MAYDDRGTRNANSAVVTFYDRKGDFSDLNLADVDGPLSDVELAEGDETVLVAFLLSLTDDRVRKEMAPFDHPQLFVPSGGTFASPAPPIVVPAVGADGRPPKGLAPLGTFLSLSPFD